MHLKGLTSLWKRVLDGPHVTDSGLVRLKGLTKLKGLNLSFAQVTDAGVAELRKALPNCEIRCP